MSNLIGSEIDRCLQFIQHWVSMRLVLQILERESADFIGLWINAVLYNLNAFQRILFFLENDTNQHNVACHMFTSFCLLLFLSFGHQRPAPERFFRPALNSLQGKNLFTLSHWSNCWLPFQGVFLCFFSSFFFFNTFFPFLHRITLYLIFISLLPINLTSLLALVPSPLPTQKLWW